MDTTPPWSDPTSPPSHVPARAATPRAPATPHAPEGVELALWHPLRTVDVVLASPERVAANVDARVALGRLVVVFLVCGALFSVPFGFVLGVESWWRVAMLYLGSTLICLPSLYVFTSYTGTRVSLTQILVLALIVPASAAVFTLGFAPILEFLTVTMSPEHTTIDVRSIARVLLGISLAAGIVQLWRCFLGARQQPQPVLLALVLLVWHGVFLYVFVRMFRVLAL